MYAASCASGRHVAVSCLCLPHLSDGRVPRLLLYCILIITPVSWCRREALFCTGLCRKVMGLGPETDEGEDAGFGLGITPG